MFSHVASKEAAIKSQSKIPRFTNRRKSRGLLIGIIVCIVIVVGGISFQNGLSENSHYNASTYHATSSEIPISDISTLANINIDDIPDYSGAPYITLNDNIPTFSEEEINVPDGTEIYGDLDRLGRATFAFAKVCETTMPPKGSTRDNKMPDPTGFIQRKYENIGLDHLYERTHLIARSFNDEDVNICDIITGTSFMNQDTMGQFESIIQSYLYSSKYGWGDNKHVLMKVVPDFRGNDLVARGVWIEALSLEDEGQSVQMNVYCYNVQPGVEINYATGTSSLAA